MEKIWLKNYPEGIPHEINPDVYASLPDMFEAVFKKYKSLPAYVNFGTSMTYEAMDKATRDFAAFLQQGLNLKKGDRFAIMLPNLLQFPVALMGALRAGLVVVNINPLYTARELEFQLRDADCSTLLVVANFAHVVQTVLPKVNLKNIIITEMGDLLSFPKSCLVNFIVKHIKHLVPNYQIPGALKFKDTLKQGAGLKFQKPDIHSEDLAFLQYTGGTTGRAKGAMLTHRNMIANSEQAVAWVSPFTRMGDETILTALPLYHIFALTANCFAYMRLGALNVLITNPRDLNHYMKEIQKYKFTAITGVNTLFNAMLNHPGIHKLDTSRLHLVLGGGMPVQHSVAERWKATTGCALLEAYGLTETSPAVCINPFNLHEYNGSIGLPVPSTDISIRDDNEIEVPIGTPGELWVKGPQVMKGYWKNEEETRNTLKNGWVRTGDIATIDPEGFIRIVDRKKDMILISGFNVYPNEVEDVIATLPGVREVAVVGVPDPNHGERVKAFVVRKNPNLTQDDIIRHCHQFLTPYKVPKEVEFRQELPKTNVGKILRRELR